MSKCAAFLAIIVLTSVGCSSGGVKNQESQLVNLMNQADEDYKNALLSEAEAKYLKVLEKAPKSSEAYAKLGNIYVRMGYLGAAVERYDQCIKYDPEDVRCWNNKALARVKQGMRTLREGKDRVVANSDGYYMLERLYRELVEVVASDH